MPWNRKDKEISLIEGRVSKINLSNNKKDKGDVLSGIYTIRCSSSIKSCGWLSYESKEDFSSQVLEGENYARIHEIYENEGYRRRSVLWEISIEKEENDKNQDTKKAKKYTIKNMSLDGGYLGTNSSNKIVVFYGDFYDKQYKLYQKGTWLREKILWEIDAEKEENEKYKYILKQISGVSGKIGDRISGDKVTYHQRALFYNYAARTFNPSSTGTYVGTVRDTDENVLLYGPNGVIRENILWELNPQEE